MYGRRVGLYNMFQIDGYSITLISLSVLHLREGSSEHIYNFRISNGGNILAVDLVPEAFQSSHRRVG